MVVRSASAATGAPTIASTTGMCTSKASWMYVPSSFCRIRSTRLSARNPERSTSSSSCERFSASPISSSSTVAGPTASRRRINDQGYAIRLHRAMAKALQDTDGVVSPQRGCGDLRPRRGV